MLVCVMEGEYVCVMEGAGRGQGGGREGAGLFQ